MSDDKQRSQKKWSAEVTRRSDALDLEAEVFKKSPTGIAQSLKRSAERSKRRKWLARETARFGLVNRELPA